MSELEAKRARLAELRRQREERTKLEAQNLPKEPPISHDSSEQASGSRLEDAVPGQTNPVQTSGDPMFKKEYAEGHSVENHTKTKNVWGPTTPVVLWESEAPIFYTKSTQTSRNLSDSEPEDKSIEDLRASYGLLALGDRTNVENASLEEESPDLLETQSWKFADPSDDDRLRMFLDTSWRSISRVLDNAAPAIDADLASRDLDQISLNTIQVSSQFSGTVKGRISALAWSPQRPETFAVAYPESKSIHIWCLQAPTDPEWTLSAPTGILALKFSPQSPDILYGAGENGQIFLWDLERGRFRLHPHISSSLDGSGHLFPVHSLEILLAPPSHLLATCSLDGTVCIWSPELLTRPRDKIALSDKAPRSLQSVQSFAMHPEDNSLFFVSKTDGSILRGQRINKIGARSGIDPSVVFQGHTGPVYTMAPKINHVGDSLGSLMLTSGIDWTIKLWKIHQLSVDGLQWRPEKQETRKVISPVAEFSLSDAVPDVAWCPIHPGIFASICRNQIQIWDLLSDLEDPVATLDCPHMLSKVTWTQQNNLVVGDNEGYMAVATVSTDLLTPPENASARIRALLALD